MIDSYVSCSWTSSFDLVPFLLHLFNFDALNIDAKLKSVYIFERSLLFFLLESMVLSLKSLFFEASIKLLESNRLLVGELSWLKTCHTRIRGMFTVLPTPGKHHWVKPTTGYY